MNAEDMDTFVFCIANKKTAAKLAKEMADITTFCPERRSAVPDKVLASRNHMGEGGGVIPHIPPNVLKVLTIVTHLHSIAARTSGINCFQLFHYVRDS